LTLGELVAQTARRFAAARLHYGHGSDNPDDEAAWLVLRGLGLSFEADLTRQVSDSEKRSISRLARARIRERIPTAYLLNEAWLDGLSFFVDRRVIVPRSHLAELLRAGMRPWLRGPARRILDLCTGSACLAILAAHAFPRARVDASDVSPAALAVARRNVAHYRLTRRIRLIRSDLFSALGRERYDLVLTNPPYVSTADMRTLPPEYRHEPGGALAGGRDGLDFVSRILAAAPEHLSDTGLLACEVGSGRSALERAYPRLPLLWPKQEVFIYEPARTATAPRNAARRGQAAG
jgi:ribosomal protein L3 glutamine methyltransferase